MPQLHGGPSVGQSVTHVEPSPGQSTNQAYGEANSGHSMVDTDTVSHTVSVSYCMVSYLFFEEYSILQYRFGAVPSQAIMQGSNNADSPRPPALDGRPCPSEFRPGAASVGQANSQAPKVQGVAVATRAQIGRARWKLLLACHQVRISFAHVAPGELKRPSRDARPMPHVESGDAHRGTFLLCNECT